MASKRGSALVVPDYTSERLQIVQFLTTFQPEEDNQPLYDALLDDIANRETDKLEIQLDHVQTFFQDDSLVRNIEANTMRYVKLFSEAVDSIDRHPTKEFKRDVMDEIIDHRKKRLEPQASEPSQNIEISAKSVPAELTRRYTVSFVPRSPAVSDKPKPESSIRNIGAAQIGSLVTLRAMVTRVTDVKPLATVACYTCDTCGYELYQPIEAKSFTPLIKCTSAVCGNSSKPGTVFLQTRGTKFDKFQEIRVQELPDQVPVGHIPRSMSIHARGNCTRACMPGDVIHVDGVFLPMPYTGFRAMKAGLTCDTFLHAMRLRRNKSTYTDMKLSDEIEEQIVAEREQGDEMIYTRLARSLAPEIFGLEDVKKSLLLLLVGGVDHKFNDGLKIRGDINILMMGDPGVAKSQLLKHIGTVAPRCVYTTGKGSSGVGLTAAVTRDSVTGEVVLEGGALVLADMGICCIDEFDKMEESDRTAIYEVMEQQTVSIAKAGITTTLNARTSILAAANPVYGRYNKNRTPAENIDLPVALLSRFDLMFVMVDKADNDQDLALAHHVLYVHQHNKPRALEFEAFSPAFIRAYVCKARTFAPYVPDDLAETIVEYYTGLRTQHNDSKQLYCTPRTLLSILRLSQAAARLRFADSVSQADVDEAIRLFNAAKASTEGTTNDKKPHIDAVSDVYTFVKDQLEYPGKKIRLSQLYQKAGTRGYSQTQVLEMMKQYREIGVLDYDHHNIWLTA